MGRMQNDCMHGTRNIGYGGPHKRDKGNLIGNDIGGSVQQNNLKGEKTMKCKICGTELPVVCEDCRSIDEDKYAVSKLIEQIRITTLYLDMLQMEHRKYTGRNYEFFK